MKSANTNCPACGGPESEPVEPSVAPAMYRRCAGCRSIYSPELLAHPMTPEDWDLTPRPEPSSRDAADLLRPLGGIGAFAIAGCADLKLLEEIRGRNLSVAACDGSRRVVAEARKRSLPVELGTPGEGMLRGRFDLVLMQGLLEYSSNPQGDLEAIRKVMLPDGRVRLEAPSALGFLARNYGAEYSLFAPPGVRTLFSFDGLTILAARSGFRQISRIHKPARTVKWLIGTQNGRSRLGRLVDAALERISDPPSVLVAVARSG